jgi:hypothetical protein
LAIHFDYWHPSIDSFGFWFIKQGKVMFSIEGNADFITETKEEAKNKKYPIPYLRNKLVSYAQIFRLYKRKGFIDPYPGEDIGYL